MRTLIYLSVLFLLLSTKANGQEINKMVFSEKTNSMFLLGACNRDAFAMPEFQEWFDRNYESYTPDHAIIDQLATLQLREIRITIFMGTWCSDSRREVPRFYHIADELGISDNQITLLMVNRDKLIPASDIEKYHIERVPTFIFYGTDKNDPENEIGRIVESPVQTIEKDMLQILQKGK